MVGGAVRMSGATDRRVGHPAYNGGKALGFRPDYLIPLTESKKLPKAPSLTLHKSLYGLEDFGEIGEGDFGEPNALGVDHNIGAGFAHAETAGFADSCRFFPAPDFNFAL